MFHLGGYSKWGLQTKMATSAWTTVTRFLSGGDTAAVSEREKLLMS